MGNQKKQNIYRRRKKTEERNDNVMDFYIKNQDFIELKATYSRWPFNANLCL
jgi:hypothetical protein